MTNADKIRSMTDEELATFIKDTINTQYRHLGLPGLRESGGYWLDWLRQDAVDPIKAYFDIDALGTNEYLMRFFKRRSDHDQS